MNKSAHHCFFLCLLPAFCVLLSLASCKAPPADPRSELVIGTVCTVNAYDDGTKQLYDELFARLHSIDEEFSVNRAGSEISRINAAAGKTAVPVTADVLYVLKTALYFAELTDGAFDPTVGPLVQLWGINTDHARVPSEKEIAATLPLVNWRDVVVTENAPGTESSAGTVFLRRSGMAIDLGGIAKGYAADELVAILGKYKVRRAIVDLGGNIYAYGKKSDGSLWKIGIKDPDNEGGEPALALTLQDCTVVTSGVYERFFIQDGVRYHHILDTRTGAPAQNGWASASIICDSSITADGLSTTAFILGPEKLPAVLNKLIADKKMPVTQKPSWVFIGADRRVVASESLRNELSVAASGMGEPVFQAE